MATMEIKPIDALQIAALRKADRVCFVHKDRQSYIRAIKENKPTERDPFASDIEIVIPCETSFVSYDRTVGHCWYQPDFTAFEMQHCPQSNEEWQTIASLLKTGDVLTLRWCHAAMSTLSADEIDWCGDILQLRIERKDKKLSFHVDQSMCPRHSTARMIRDVRERRTEVSLVAA